MVYRPEELSRADIGTVLQRLQEESLRRVDVVAPSSAIDVHAHRITLNLPEPAVTDHGVVTWMNIAPSDHMIGQMSEKLEIPVKYLRQLFADSRDYKTGSHTMAGIALQEAIGWALDRKPRSSFFLRTFISDEGDAYGRAFLSNRFDASLDSLDYLVTMLDALKEAAPNATIQNIDLTEKHMRIRVEDPSIAVMAPHLLAGYRSPFGGTPGTELPVVFAGFEAGTSDVGAGSRYLVPRMVVQTCKNGLTMTSDAFSKVHLGGRMDDGVIDWSELTRERELTLIRSQISDAVNTFVSEDYLNVKIQELTELAGAEVEAPQATLVNIGKALRFSEAEVDGILGHFIKGGQTNVGGVMQAITSFAQTVDGDRQSELEHVAVQAMALV